MDIDLKPREGPHSREHTADPAACSTPAPGHHVRLDAGDASGLEYPGDAYSLVGDLYSATGRFPQVCDQLDEFTREQAASGRLYEAQGRDIGVQERGIHPPEPGRRRGPVPLPSRCGRSRRT